MLESGTHRALSWQEVSKKFALVFRCTYAEMCVCSYGRLVTIWGLAHLFVRSLANSVLESLNGILSV